MRRSDVPTHVRPDDVYYEMTLYYWNWHNEGFTDRYTGVEYFSTARVNFCSCVLALTTGLRPTLSR